MKIGRGPLLLLGAGCIILGSLAVVFWPEERPHGFVDHVYRDPEGQPHRYVVFVPQCYDYTGTESYPLVLYLHGSGAKGTDGRRQLEGGLATVIRQREREFECLALFPQAATDWRPGVEDPWRVRAILSEVETFYRVDRRRVYLTGYSMGGFGVWDLAAKHPELWATIVPVSGGGDPKKADRLAHLNCWCFHGAVDQVVPAEWSRRTITAIKLVGGTPRYTELAGRGHGIAEEVLGRDDLRDWFLSKRLPSR
jgi:predicted peptidase